ncbi:hypothetical protein V6N13_022951 [Hibiscus sabdariffa]
MNASRNHHGINLNILKWLFRWLETFWKTNQRTRKNLHNLLSKPEPNLFLRFKDMNPLIIEQSRTQRIKGRHSNKFETPIVDPEVLPQGPITRSKAKQFREALSLICAKLSDSFDIDCALDTRLYNEEGHELGDLSLARLKLRSLYAARFSLVKLIHLQLAHRSSIQLNFSSTSSTQAEQPRSS